MDDAFGNWFAGFVDGEGCFAIHVLRGNGTQKPYYSFRFYLRLRKDDEKILDTISKELGFGTVRKEMPSQNYTTTNSEVHGTSRLDISKLDYCVELVSFFDKYSLRAKKRNDYLVWRKAVLFAKQHGQGCDVFDYDPVAEIRNSRRYIP